MSKLRQGDTVLSLDNAPKKNPLSRSPIPRGCKSKNYYLPVQTIHYLEILTQKYNEVNGTRLSGSALLNKIILLKVPQILTGLKEINVEDIQNEFDIQT